MSAVAAGAVLSLMGGGVALAGSGPEPEQPPASGSAATEAGNPASVRAQATGVCADAYQIGTTSYAYRQGEEIASVKQFYSPECNENYGYVWVWKSFLDKDITFDLTVGVWSYEREYVVGAQTTAGTHEQEFWSAGTDTASECTSAEGVLTVPSEPVDYVGRSSQRC